MGNNYAEFFHRFASNRTVTHQAIFQLGGIANWMLTIGRISFAMFRPILSAMRTVGRRISRGKSWSATFIPSDLLMTAVRTLEKLARENPAIPWTPLKQHKWYLYTDAATWGLGWMMFDESGNVKDMGGREWTEEERDLNISEREMIAAVECYTALNPVAAASDATITLLIDNIVSYAALKKGFSPRPGIDKILRSVPHIRMMMTWIPSEYNLADLPSRGANLPLLKTLEEKWRLEHLKVLDYVSVRLQLPTNATSGMYEIHWRNQMTLRSDPWVSSFSGEEEK